MTVTEDVTPVRLTESTFSRGSLLRAGGALVAVTALPVSIFTAGVQEAVAATVPPNLDPTQLTSWLAVQADNTVIVRTGKVDIGNGMLTGLQQIVADELYVPFSSIKLMFGNTATTPSGGWTAGGTLNGEGTSLRRVAAYARQALLGLASTKLGVPASSLTIKDGTVSGGTGSVTYASLVAGQVLNVVIPTSGSISAGAGVQVLGSPPLKDPSTYEFVGKSIPRIDIPGKITGKTSFVADVTLPGLVYGRTIKPTTLGSTLVAVGSFPKDKFPTTQLVVKGNLVGVVSENEWEAIGAAIMVAGTTKWSDWSGLPGNANQEQAIRATSTTYKANTNIGSTFATLASASKMYSGTYMSPIAQHGPIGPYVGIADVDSDGTIYAWSNTSTPQSLRAQIATMMNTPTSKIVVNWYEGSSQYGRTSLGGDDAVGDAVILSSLVGKPVMVQWTRHDDHIWSGKTGGGVHDFQFALGSNGTIAAWRHVQYGLPQSDNRMLGGILAGTPNAAPPAASGGYGATWIYNLIPNVLIESRGAPYFGAGAPNNVGLRMNIMRSPGDYQSVFGQESIMNEAAAAAGVDPIQMRLNSLSDPRGITVLNTVRTASGWDNRPSPNPASTTTKGLLTGRGIALTKRAVDGNAVAGPTTGTWAAAVAELTVNPKTGKVVVTKMTVAYDAGFVVNPTAIYHTIESGILQQTSMTVLEEVAFNHSTVTSTDWVTYPILRIKDSPDINIVLVGSTTSAPVNAAGEPIANPIAAAISGAFYDATGKFARKLPLRSENVKAILAS